MSAHVLLNLLNKLSKRDKNARFAEHFIWNESNEFNNTGAWMLDSILSHDIKIT